MKQWQESRREVLGNYKQDSIGMTVDEQIEEFLKMYGDRLPNPEHCPKEFEYYVKLYKYVKELE